MDGTRPRVIAVVPPRTALGGALAEELRAGGFEVEPLASGARAIEAARARPPAALVVLEGMPAGWIRRLAREPALRAVPVVGVTGSDPEKPRFVPVLALLGCDGWLQTARARAPGALSAAVREAVARGKRPPPGGKERLGLWLWRLGSALALFALAFAVWMTVGVLTRRPLVPGTAWLLAASLLAFPVGELGTRLARGRQAGLGVGNWLIVGLVLAAVVAVIVPG